MAKVSSDFDFADGIYLSDLLDGSDQGEDFDAKFAEQLQIQDAIIFSLSVKETMPPSNSLTRREPKPKPKPKPKPRKHSANKKVGESSLSYCEICLERKERRLMFPISGCSHSFCSDCITMHVKTRLEENVTIIMCPGENCRVMLELDPYRPLLPKEVISLWEDLLCEELLCATGGRFYCPFKDCSALLVNDHNQEEILIKDSECPYCHRLFCAQCHVPWHPGIDCEEFQKLNEDERGREDIMVKNLAKEKKWRRCPSCHIIVERTDGCLHMTCRCKFEFCYRCGEKWSQDHGGCQGN